MEIEGQVRDVKNLYIVSREEGNMGRWNIFHYDSFHKVGVKNIAFICSIKFLSTILHRAIIFHILFEVSNKIQSSLIK